MKRPPASLDDLLAAARQAPPRADAPDDDAPLPPGTAVRIAARWAATAPLPNRARAWERLSYVGLAVALVLCGIAAWTAPQHKTVAAAVEDDLQLGDFLDADFDATATTPPF